MDTRVAIGIGLIIYVVLTTLVSFFMMTRVRKPADYLVAGRGLPKWVLIGTITGTCIGTGVIVGGSGLAYKHGWAGAAYPIGLGLGTLVTGLLFSEMRRYKFMTLSEEVSCYYEGNRWVTEFSNLSLFLSQLCWLTVQIKGGAAVLAEVTGLQQSLCIVLAGLAKAIISIPGGLKAVVYTDVLQTTILLCGFACLIKAALHEVGGLAGLNHAVPAPYVSFLGMESYGAWNIVSLILVLVLNPIADPGRRLTIYSAESESGARLSMVASGVIVIIFAAAIGIAGMFTFHLNPNLANSDETLPWLVMHQLPAWLAAFVVVAMIAGMSSAANGNAAAAGTFYVRHIFPLFTGRFPKNPVHTARWALVFAFFFSTGLALFTGSIVGFVTRFLPLTMSGLGVCILLGRFWPRVNWRGALAALIVTPAAYLGLMLFLKNPTLPATAAGAVALAAVSLATPRPTRSFAEIASAMTAERESLEGQVPATHH